MMHELNCFVVVVLNGIVYRNSYPLHCAPMRAEAVYHYVMIISEPKKLDQFKKNLNNLSDVIHLRCGKREIWGLALYN